MKICPQCAAPFTSADWVCPHCAWAAPRRGAIRSIAPQPSVEGFSASFFERLAVAEDAHFWFAARNALITWALARYFPGAGTFLDAGCGNGQVCRALGRAFPAMRLTAAEPFVEGLAMVERKAPGAELVQADVRQLPWIDEFDVAGAFDVLEHVRDDARALRALARAVRPGGGVMITVPQHQWLWSPIDEYSGHVRRYSRALLRSRLEGAGLRVERLTSFVTLLLPMLVASRASRRRAPADPCAELNLSSLANRVGAAAMGAERAMIRAGVSLPAGGSLLAIARRPED